MADVLPIYANTDVHGFYNKQKSEFHFQQKTDNEFLMFLLDTAVRVISIGELSCKGLLNALKMLLKFCGYRKFHVHQV